MNAEYTQSREHYVGILSLQFKAFYEDNQNYHGIHQLQYKACCEDVTNIILAAAFFLYIQVNF